MGVQVESLWSGLFDEDGNPLNGGKVYTYTTGTSTAKAMYTDAAETTEATNPIILDSEGRALVFAGTGLYRLVIQTSAGTTLRTIDSLSWHPGIQYTNQPQTGFYDDGTNLIYYRNGEEIVRW